MAAPQSLDILKLQLVGNKLGNEALMRYVSVPENLDAIVGIFQVALDSMRDLPTPQELSCQPGWCPDRGRCVPCDIDDLPLE